jgi:pimeloyl-ACP methyl ester carboxylesterase
MTTVAESVEKLSIEIPPGLPAVGEVSARIDIGDARLLMTLAGGKLELAAARDRDDRAVFSVTVPGDAWDHFCAQPPPRGYTTAQAMVATLGAETVGGDRVAWATYARLVDWVLDALRVQHVGAKPAPNPDPGVVREPQTVGRYLTVDVAGTEQRIYYESAGQGQPVLCLHTAGADSRQFRYLLEDPELTKRFQFVAFDMPWHGRSDPPDDWASTRYQLTTEAYAETILAVMEALELERPVLLGCSMGGAICLYMASRHGGRFRAVLALEGGLGNPGRFVPWTNHLQVDHSHFLTSWVGGLMAPSSPSGPRSQTLWGYAQSGPGVYQGDTYFYSTDFPKHSGSLQRATCPLWVFSGEYDYSATTEMSREAAERLGGELVEMKGSGHFPMSEDPVVFRAYLVPVLDRALAEDRGSR